MPYIQSSIPQPNKVYNFSVSNFAGGLNNRSDVLKDNESPDLLNMVFTSSDIMAKRNGQKYFNGDDYKEPITFIDEYIGAGTSNISPKWGYSVWGDSFKNSTMNLVVATDKKLYINNQAITDVTSKVTGISHIGNYYFVDGGSMFTYGKFPTVTSTYVKIIGTAPENSSLMKIVSPSEDYTPLDREEIDKGSINIITVEDIRKENNRIQVRLDFTDTWYILDLENSSDVYVGKKYTADYGDLKNVVIVFDIQIDELTKEITVRLDDGKWYTLLRPNGEGVGTNKKYVATYDKDDPTKVLLKEVDGNYSVILKSLPEGDKHLKGVTVYDYDNKKIWYEPCLLEIEDEYKGANVIPSNVSFIVNHKGRIFVAGDEKDDDNVFISDVENPYYFPVGLPIQVPPDSDKIVDLIVYDDSIIVARQRDIYVLTGMTNRLDAGLELFALRKLNTHTGFTNSTCANVVHNYLFFLGRDGNAYSLSSTRHNDRTMVTSLINQTIDFSIEPINFNLEEIKSAITYFYNDNWYIHIKNKTIVYSYRHMAWTLLDGLDVCSFFSMNNKLVWGTSKGRIAEFSNDYMDFGSPYEAYWTSKYFDVGEPSEFKHFRSFTIVSEITEKFDSDVYVSFFVDYFDAKYYSLISHRTTKWGVNKWGDVALNHNVLHSTPYYINRRGRNIRFVVRNGYKVTNTVDLLGHLYAYPNKKDGELVYVRAEDSHYLYHHTHIDSSYTGGSLEDELRSMGWRRMDKKELNQPMKVYQINFNYEERRRYV